MNSEILTVLLVTLWIIKDWKHKENYKKYCPLQLCVATCPLQLLVKTGDKGAGEGNSTRWINMVATQRFWSHIVGVVVDGWQPQWIYFIHFLLEVAMDKFFYYWKQQDIVFACLDSISFKEWYSRNLPLPFWTSDRSLSYICVGNVY